MHQINLLYVITKLELGGAQKQLLSLISHLDKKRYNLSLITAYDGLLIKDALSIKKLKLIRSRFLERPINPLKDFFALFQIYRFIRNNKIDIVHTHSSKAGMLGRWAARLAHVKVIVHTVHGWSFNEYQNPIWRWIIIWLERITSLITDQLIVVSAFDLQKGLDNHIGYRDKYKLIRYGINYQEFNKQDRSLREDLGIDPDDLVVGMVSCFKPQKSPQDFIKLAFLLNNPQISNGVKFILVGDGVLRNQIEKLISKLDLRHRVILTGWREDISRILSAIDIFVLTSLWEGLPVSVLEAMAASRPVLATNTGGIAEVIFEGRTGFLVFPRNIKEMSEKLTCLLEDANLREKIGQHARDSLNSNFSLGSMLRNTEDAYPDLISSALPKVG